MPDSIEFAVGCEVGVRAFLGTDEDGRETWKDFPSNKCYHAWKRDSIYLREIYSSLARFIFPILCNNGENWPFSIHRFDMDQICEYINRIGIYRDNSR